MTSGPVPRGYIWSLLNNNRNVTPINCSALSIQTLSQNHQIVDEGKLVFIKVVWQLNEERMMKITTLKLLMSNDLVMIINYC